MRYSNNFEFLNRKFYLFFFVVITVIFFKINVLAVGNPSKEVKVESNKKVVVKSVSKKISNSNKKELTSKKSIEKFDEKTDTTNKNILTKQEKASTEIATDEVEIEVEEDESKYQEIKEDNWLKIRVLEIVKENGFPIAAYIKDLYSGQIKLFFEGDMIGKYYKIVKINNNSLELQDGLGNILIVMEKPIIIPKQLKNLYKKYTVGMKSILDKIKQDEYKERKKRKYKELMEGKNGKNKERKNKFSTK